MSVYDSVLEPVRENVEGEFGQDPEGPENAGGGDGIGDDGSDGGSGGEGGEPGGSDLPDNPYDPGDGFPGDENVDPPGGDPDPSEPDTPSDGPEPQPDLPDQNEPEPQGPRVERWDLSSQGPWSGRDSVTSRGSMDQRIGGTALLIRLVTSGRVSAAVAVSTGGTLAGQTVTVRIMRGSNQPGFLMGPFDIVGEATGTISAGGRATITLTTPPGTARRDVLYVVDVFLGGGRSGVRVVTAVRASEVR